MKNTLKKGLREKGMGAVLCVSCGVMALVSFGTLKHRRADSLGTQQLVRAINAATHAQEGNIADVQVKHEKSHTFVDVNIFSSQGRKYAVRVEGATGKVLSVAQAHDGIVQTGAG